MAALPAPRSSITHWLMDWTGGDKSALDRLTPFVYSELRRLAGRLLRAQPPGQSLHATVLVHEAYLRLVDNDRVEWRNRAHFFGIAAKCMREILVDRARTRQAAKRGGGMRKVALDEVLVDCGGPTPEIMDLDRALLELAALDARKSQLVELRYFGGLTTDEMAEVVGVSTATVARELRVAQAWLHRQLSP
jgi:RNA polymerase sigma factor (TIGR02999 family)